MTELSELDTAILRQLQTNARSTNRASPRPSTSQRQPRSSGSATLRERGVIRGYHAEADLAALGRNVQALIAIRIRPPPARTSKAFRDWPIASPRLSASSSSRQA